ncbi:MAG: protein kinase [Candidatus Zixiibacteriota bacterium]|nr:MAG: protein kinase [candidate division Zixibacteria bacterium]
MMDECKQPDIQKLLHAWELGMLSEADRERVEVHLVDCHSCSEVISRFERAARAMRDHEVVREAVREIIEKAEGAAPDEMDFSDEATKTHAVIAGGTEVLHYRIVERLGAGGMGEVYLAKDTKLDRQVAIKFMPAQLASDEDFKARFTREAQAAAKLNHPNIVSIYEIGEHLGRPFFVMERVEGRSLADIMKKELALADILDKAVQLCEGLQAAHKAGVVHRDVKPSNIMIDQEGRARVLDFGLAAVQGAEHLTRTGSTLGTMGYMSPEQTSGAKIDHRSDLFSLGVILYEMFTGRHPFRRDNDAATIRAITTETPEPLARYRAGVPDSLQQVVSKLLEKQPDLRYQSAADVAADLRRAQRELGSPLTAMEEIEPQTRRKRWPTYVRVSVVAAAILVLLILRPWRFEISPTDEAIAIENRLAIMYFINTVEPDDPMKLGEIATDLLITDLSESHYVQVVSSQRLYDILKLVGREGTKKIDRALASEVAQRARAKFMLTGNILQVEPQLVLTSQLVDVTTGNVVASQRIAGEPGDKIFSLVDRLTVQLKDDLSLPSSAQQERDPQIASVTTNSLEAYQTFLLGREYYYKGYLPEAEPYFRRVIDLDSTFAMAYIMLASIKWTQHDPEAAILTTKAARDMDRLTERERFWIRSFQAALAGEWEEATGWLEKLIDRYPDVKEAYYWKAWRNRNFLDEHDEAVELLEQAIDLDPMFKTAYGLLARALETAGEQQEAMWAIDKYIELAPHEAWPYSRQGDIYYLRGQIDSAIISYEKALANNPDFLMAAGRVVDLYLRVGNYEKATSTFMALTKVPRKGRRSDYRTGLALVPLYLGMFDSALTLLDAGIGVDVLEGATHGDQGDRAHKHWLKAKIYSERNEHEKAIEEIDKYLDIRREHDPDALYYGLDNKVEVLASAGNLDQADRVLREMMADIRDTEDEETYGNWAEGILAFSRGDADAAINSLRKTVGVSPRFGALYWLGRAYLEAGQTDEAIEAFRRLNEVTYRWRYYCGIMAVKSYYYLGRAYERDGDTEKAVEQYEAFLDIWKNADPGIELIDDAKERLTRLGQEH